MKTAIYIEDGMVQLVITPETEFEKSSLTMFREEPLKAKMFDGSFYDCRGGWVRQTAYRGRDPFANYGTKDDESLIIRVDEARDIPVKGEEG